MKIRENLAYATHEELERTGFEEDPTLGYKKTDLGLLPRAMVKKVNWNLDGSSTPVTLRAELGEGGYQVYVTSNRKIEIDMLERRPDSMLPEIISRIENQDDALGWALE